MEKCIKNYFPSGKIRSELYYYNSEMHRDNLPAYMGYFDNGKIHYEFYYKEGKRHREDGPAQITYYKNGKIENAAYCLDGEHYIDKAIIDNWEDFCKMQVFR